MNYKVTVAYNGAQYSGWAIQGEINTIQLCIERILKKIYSQSITIMASGRTDARVHALNQVFNFNENKLLIKPPKLLAALNAYAPDDIYFKKVNVVNSKFNARFSAANKTYIYLINIGKYDVFKKDLILQYNSALDIKTMRNASTVLIGRHNFLSYSTSEKVDTIRTIETIKITKTKDLVKITISANGFLRNMVRMIVGNLIDVSNGKKDNNTLKQLLETPIKGKSISKSPACGLYLKKVKYK